MNFFRSSEETVLKKKSRLPPSEYFRENFYFTIETEEPELIDAIALIGAGHFLVATDYPHDDPGGRMKWKDAELLDGNDRIDEQDKDLIRCGNATRVFKL